MLLKSKFLNFIRLNPLLSFLLFIFLSFSISASENGLKLTEKIVEDDTLYVINNEFYEVSIIPSYGAVINGLKLKPTGEEVTSFEKGDYSGLLQETGTAGMPYEVVKKEVDETRISIAFAAEAGRYSVEKKLTFKAGCPLIEVSMSFENTSGQYLRNDLAPSIFNVLHGKTSPLKRGFFTLGGPYSSQTYGPDALLRRFHPLLEGNDLQLHWLAGIEPVIKAGIGIVHLDSAPDRFLAVKNSHGVIGTELRIQDLAPDEKMTTKMLLIPLQGLPAVDFISEDFLAETLYQKSASEKMLSLRVKSLMEGPINISIVNRAYNKNGEEIGPLETIVFDNLDQFSIVGDTINVGGHQLEDMAWVSHEIYSNGRRIQHFTVKIAESQAKPAVRAKTLPPPKLEKLDPGDENVVSEESPERAAKNPLPFDVQRLSGPDWQPFQKIDVSMGKGTSKTLLFKIRAQELIEDIQVGIINVTGKEPEENDVLNLSASNYFLWEIINPHSQTAELQTFRRQDIQEDEEVFFAVTLSSSELKAGEYGARLLVSSREETLEFPLHLRVFPVEIKPDAGFALQQLVGDVGLASETVFNFTDTVSAKALNFHMSAQTEKMEWEFAIDAARRAGIETFGLYSPGMAAVCAEMVAQSYNSENVIQDEGGLNWLICSRADGVESADAVAKMGFSPFFFFYRLPPGLLENLDAPFNLHNAIVGGDIPAGKHDLFEYIADNEGDARPALWRLSDLRSYNWSELVFHLRNEFYYALLGGFQGSALVVGQSLFQTQANLISWHIIRDIREEAALVALARNAIKNPEKEIPEDLRREFQTLFPESNSGTIFLAHGKGPFGEVKRLQLDERETHILGHKARHTALNILTHVN